MDPKTQVQDFISIIKRHRKVWDKSSKDHHNSYALERTWLRIAHETNLSVKEAQTKWKSLRDYYRKEFRRLAETNGSEFREESIGETTWPYFNYLTFLRDQFKQKNPASSLQDPLSIPINQESLDDPVFVTTVKIENVEEDSSLERSDSDLLWCPTEEQHGQNRLQGSSMYPTPPGKRRKISRNVDADASEVIITSSGNQYDEDRHFFESLLPHTKRIQGLDKMLFREEVQKLIMKYAYSEKNTVSGSTAEVSQRGCYPDEWK